MKLKALTVVLLMLASLNSIQAQWVQTNGPEGGTINCFTHYGSDIWLGCTTGIYKSNNEGLSWVKSGVLNNIYVIDMYATNDTIVIMFQTPVSPGSNYVDIKSMTSLDNGLTWNTSPTIQTAFNTAFQNLYSRFMRCQDGLIFDFNGTILQSLDFGLTWINIVFPANFHCSTILTSPHRVLASGYHNTTYAPMNFISTDMMQTWQDIGTSGHPLLWYISDSIILSVVYETVGSVTTESILRSADTGQSWDTVFQKDSITQLGPFYQVRDSIYAYCNPDGYYYSADLGLTWHPGVLPDDFFFRSLTLSNGDILHYDNYHVERYVQTLHASVPSNTGYRGQYINALRNCNDRLYASTFDNLYRSADGGQTWVATLPDYYEFNSIFSMEFTHDTIFWVNDKFLGRSFNDGITFDTITLPGSAYYQSVNSITRIGNRLFLSIDHFWYSDDWGTTWNSMPDFPTTTGGSGNSDHTGYIKAFGGELYGVGNEGYIYKYNPNTTQWDFSLSFWSTGANNGNIFFVMNNKLIVKGRLKFAYTINGGTTWTNITGNGLPVVSGNKVYPSNLSFYQGYWIGSIPNTGIYFSSDQGENWTVLPGTPTDVQLRSLAILNNVLYSGSYYNSVWRRMGSIYTISGTVYQDNNNNGVKDPGEPGVSDMVVSSSPTGWVCSTDTAGHYNLLCDATADTLRPAYLNSWIVYNPGFRIASAAAVDQNFGLYAMPGIYDLGIDATNYNMFRPGFNTYVNLRVLNKGTVIQQPLVKFVIPANLDYQSASPSPNNINGDTLSWQLGNLGFLNFHDIELVVRTIPGTPLGDSVICLSQVFPAGQDVFPADNQYILRKVVQGSYDPNDKTCEQGGLFPPANIAQGNEMQFVIRFQNTGNLPTVFVQVTDTLSPYLDWSSFRLISSSDPVEWTIHNPGVVEFEFNPCALQPASVNEPESMGYVKYGVKCRLLTPIGSVVTNKAYIYFDFNPPIITNMTTTLVANLVLVEIADIENAKDKLTLLAYPNPAQSELNLDIKGEIKEPLSCMITDFTGREIRKTAILTNHNQISTLDLPAGIYIGNLMTQKGRRIGAFKFIVKH